MSTSAMKTLWKTVSKPLSSSASASTAPCHEPDPSIQVPPKYEDRVKRVEALMLDRVAQREGDHIHWDWSHFEVGRELGKGGFGEVLLAKEHETQFVVALKAMSASRNHAGPIPSEKRKKIQSGITLLIKEIEIQSRLKHPNILALYNYFWIAPVQMVLILECAAGVLKVPSSGFKPPVAALYIYQVASALQYCHEMNVVHRDIKPANILLDVYGNVKLADFGLSAHSPRNRRKSMCGTSYYFAPELTKGERYWSKVDNWALGILAYTFLEGTMPFTGCFMGEKALFKEIQEEDPEFNDDTEEGAVDLITKLLKKQPNRRLSLRKVLVHPWILKYVRGDGSPRRSSCSMHKSSEMRKSLGSSTMPSEEKKLKKIFKAIT